MEHLFWMYLWNTYFGCTYGTYKKKQKKKIKIKIKKRRKMQRNGLVHGELYYYYYYFKKNEKKKKKKMQKSIRLIAQNINRYMTHSVQ